MSNSTTAPLNARAQERVAVYRIEQRYRTLRTTIRAAFGGFAVWCLYLATDSVAGKTTKLATLKSKGYFSEKWVRVTVQADGKSIRARLCRQGKELVYVLTVLAYDGKVTTATIDGASGAVMGGRR